MAKEDQYTNSTEEIKAKTVAEFPKFISDLGRSLRSATILEVGCKEGSNLAGFSDDSHVSGINENEKELEKARKRFPFFKFQNGPVLEIPFPDSSIDFVFTVTVMNSIKDSDMPKALNELFRVSNKYILNCEFFKEDEGPIQNENGLSFSSRNMFKRWLDFKVKIVSNVDFHEDIDPEKKRFTLVKKIIN